MTRIDVRLAPWTRPLLAVVATHGLTDLSQPRVFGRYACWLALPLPSRAVTVLFCLASWVHLRRELGGGGGSLFVHALVREVHRLLGAQAAFDAFLVYFALVHTPTHYVTETGRGNGALVCACLAASALLWAVGRAWPAFALTDGAQRLVAAHVVTVCHADRLAAPRAARRAAAPRAPRPPGKTTAPRGRRG